MKSTIPFDLIFKKLIKNYPDITMDWVLDWIRKEEKRRSEYGFIYIFNDLEINSDPINIVKFLTAISEDFDKFINASINKQKEGIDEIIDSIYLHGSKEDGIYSLTMEQLENAAKEIYMKMKSGTIKI